MPGLTRYLLRTGSSATLFLDWYGHKTDQRLIAISNIYYICTRVLSISFYTLLEFLVYV